MRIRSVTIFSGTVGADLEAAVKSAAKLSSDIKKRLIHAGYEVQTTRLALPPVSDWLGAQDLIEAAIRIEKSAGASGIDYVSLGPISVEHLLALPELIRKTNTVFSSISITDSKSNVLSGVLPELSNAILEIARTTPNGFGNLRFCASAQCGAGIPFFPAAYSENKAGLSFALANESADLALEACREAKNSGDAMARLTQAIEMHSKKMQSALGADARFTGFDWSLAPHPDADKSIGAALEALSGTPIGGWGTLSSVAALTRAIRRAKVPHVGFSGIFLPVLEDAMLAKRAAEGAYDLHRLLLYSAVCGSGLDTIPLPGDVSADAISAALADIATLATVLNKPLTARFMPVPGLTAGCRTSFDFPYLVNTTPLELKGGAGKLLRDEKFGLGIE